eukprot:Rhum_TRINITY_DN18580_c0_g1::Rhum_TRINITY_DN18580_c0_g1_i1::g.167755::m.167755
MVKVTVVVVRVGIDATAVPAGAAHVPVPSVTAMVSVAVKAATGAVTEMVTTVPRVGFAGAAAIVCAAVFGTALNAAKKNSRLEAHSTSHFRLPRPPQQAIVAHALPTCEPVQ